MQQVTGIGNLYFSYNDQNVLEMTSLKKGPKYFEQCILFFIIFIMNYFYDNLI